MCPVDRPVTHARGYALAQVGLAGHAQAIELILQLAKLAAQAPGAVDRLSADRYDVVVARGQPPQPPRDNREPTVVDH